MNYLEEIINNNRELFDSEEPGQKHISNFREKINSYFGNTRHSILLKMNKYAAVFLLGLSISTGLVLLVFYYNFSDPKDHYLLNNPELIEVEYYYQRRITDNISRLKNMAEKNNALPSRHIINDINEVNQTIKKIKKDLYYHPNDERIINALINSYKMKLEITDQVLNLTTQSKS